MANKRKNNYLPLILILIALVFVGAIVWRSFSSKPEEKPAQTATDPKKQDKPADDETDIQKDNPTFHGNGMQELGSIDTEVSQQEENTITPEGADTSKIYSLQCRFEGIIDENSFEVTELNRNIETGEFEDGNLLQLRIGTDHVRSDITVAEMGQQMTIECRYNSNSQLIADRILLTQPQE